MIFPYEAGSYLSVLQGVTIGAGAKYHDEKQTNRPIIGNNVTIYANAVVLGGITIGDNVIIGAGAVVLNDCEANGVYVGNPAHRVK